MLWACVSFFIIICYLIEGCGSVCGGSVGMSGCDVGLGVVMDVCLLTLFRFLLFLPFSPFSPFSPCFSFFSFFFFFSDSVACVWRDAMAVAQRGVCAWWCWRLRMMRVMQQRVSCGCGGCGERGSVCECVCFVVC